MSGNIFNSDGAPVAVVEGAAIFDLKGRKLYHLKGVNIYRLPASWSAISTARKARISGSIVSLAGYSPPEAVLKSPAVYSPHSRQVIQTPAPLVTMW
jgi:hypothetical protein